MVVLLQASCGPLDAEGPSLHDFEQRPEASVLPPHSTLTVRCGAAAITGLDVSYGTTIVVRFISATSSSGIREWYQRQLTPLGWSLTNGGLANGADRIDLSCLMTPAPSMK
jgi:hypothetical protein